MTRRPLISIMAVLAVGGLTTSCGSSSTSSTPGTSGTSSTPGTVDPATVVTFAEQSQDHVETPVSYVESPPIGGEHSKIWQNCGFYSTPIASENGVHSMEHGAVWITFSPDLPVDHQAQLKAMTIGHTHVLISSFPGLNSPVVGSGWRVQQRFPTFDAAAITAFIAAYENGTQTPEPGAPCDGGLGDPES